MKEYRDGNNYNKYKNLSSILTLTPCRYWLCYAFSATPYAPVSQVRHVAASSRNCANIRQSVNDVLKTDSKQRKKSKRHFRSGFINLFIILGCCITVPGIGRTVTGFPLAADRQQKIQLSADVSGQSNADGTEWYLILVNNRNYIPEDYEVELTKLSNGQTVDKRIYPALQKMFDAARSAGVYPIVASGYRTAEMQQSLMDGKIAEYKAMGFSAEESIEKAEAWVAIPGTSEHQLGIAVDINADGIHSSGYEVYDWLGKNSHKFGFIRRYAADKTDVTGVIDEPWHYRYVGVDAASEIYSRGICLEEYIDRR